MRVAFVAAVLVLLASCAPWNVAGPGRIGVGGGRLSVEPGIAWNRQTAPGENTSIEVWTQHGPLLDQLLFYVAIAPGQPLVQGPAGSGYPKFRKGMTAVDVMELYEASLLKALGARDIKVRSLAPARFADSDGFRFQLAYALPDDVDRELTAIGTIRDDKLYMIAWAGTRLYHYQKSLAEFERIAASAQIRD